MWARIEIFIIVFYTFHSQCVAANVSDVPGPVPAPNGFGMRFRLPFIDMNIKSVFNLKIIKDAAGQQVFVLHGAELYQLVLEREVKRLTLIATLGGDVKDSDLLGAEVISWGNYILLVVAIDEHLEVYQIAKKTIAERTLCPVEENTDSLVLDPIQKITLYGRYRAIFLCEPSEDSVTLIVLVNFTKLYSHLNIYVWSETYFNPSEEETIAPVQTMKIIGTESKYLVFSRMSKAQTTITVIVYSVTSSLEQIQALQLKSKSVHPFTYQGINYLLSCSVGQTKCTSFKMTDGRFAAYKYRPAAEFYFNLFTAGEHFLVGQRESEVSVYVDTRMECYGSFKSNTLDVTSILTHQNEEGNSFVLLNYIRPAAMTLVRVVEIEYERNVSSNYTDFGDVHELGAALKQQRHVFEESIKKLRTVLLSRKYPFDDIKKSIASINAKAREVVFKNPLHIRSGQIGIVKLVNSKLRSPLQIQDRLHALSKGDQRMRFSRGFKYDRNETSLNLKVRHLRVGNLIYDGDLIPGFNLNSDESYLMIALPVTTAILDTKELLTATVLDRKKERRFFTRSVGESQMKFRKLRVNRINGVSWDSFFRNLFLRSRDRSISGRLIVQAGLQVGNLITTFLNTLPAERLFNLVDAQNVTSDIVISRFFVNDLQVDRLNELDFPRDIARKGVENFIKSPVVALDVSITSKLILSERDHKARHVFGTNVLDFQQTYTGKVVIEGSLTLGNLNTLDSRLFVDGKDVPTDIASVFWMHSVSQAFESTVSLTKCQVSAPSLNTVHLNNNRVTDYVLTTGQQSLNPILLIFLSAQIAGNLIADPTFGTKLRQIHNNAVQRDMRNGDRLIIFGQKHFRGSLTMDHCETAMLNNLPSIDLITTSEKTCVFTGKKSFKSIELAKEASVAKNLDLRLLNGALEVHDLFKSEYRFGTVVLRSSLKAKHVFFEYLNGFPSKRLLNSIRSFDDKLILHKDLYIEGHIQFESNVQVDTINNIVWEDYLQSLVKVHDNTVISGRKTFTSALTIVKNLKTLTINDIAIDDIFKNVLLKSQHQNISGAYTFDIVRLTNVDVPYVNKFRTSDFIDTRSSEVIFNGDLVVNNLQVYGSLFGSVGMDFYDVEHRVKAITHKPWKNIHVLGDAYWPWGNDQQSVNIQYLYANAVRHLDDQVITGNVNLRKPLITTMNTKDPFPTDINFDGIASDCLFHNSSSEEVVIAAKVFTKPIHFADVIAVGHMGSQIVNRVDILEFNASLYRISRPTILYGPLTFQSPPIFGDLIVQGTVNSQKPNHIFLAHTDNQWPPVNLQSLHVEGELRLFDIDHMNLDFLLNNRIRKYGPAQEVFGHLTFEELVLEKDIFMQSINAIAIDNTVQKDSQGLQEISAPKTILGDLRLIGPTMVVRLNGEDIVERYRHTVFLTQDYSFDRLSIESAKFKNGLVVNSSFANHSISGSPQDASYKAAFQQHTETLKKISASLRAVEDILDAKAMNPRRLVYLDYDFSTIIEWKSSNDSIQEQFIFDNNRYQYCDREQTIVKWSKHHNRILLSKSTTNTITADEHGVQVTAENNCIDSYRNVQSRISITDPEFIKRFTTDKLVQSIDIYYATNIYVLLHLIDMYAGINEIRILKIDNNLKTIQNWQLLTDGVGKVSRLFKLQSHTILVVSTIIDNYPSITIYNLNADDQIFEVVQVIDGDFDVIELAQITPHSYHLFLSCVHCQRIVIFEYDALTTEDCHVYHIYQMIKLKTRIDKFNLFTLPDGGIYLLVLSDQDIDFYHIYKYKYVQGWKHYTYGYFKNIQSAYPLLRDGLSSVDDNLLLLCNRKCTLVKAFYQS